MFSQLWRDRVEQNRARFPSVEASATSMWITPRMNGSAPKQFRCAAHRQPVRRQSFSDVEAASAHRSIGMLRSASLGASGEGVFEAVLHGSAPDIAGSIGPNPPGHGALSAAMFAARRAVKQGRSRDQAGAGCRTAVFGRAIRTGDLGRPAARPPWAVSAMVSWCWRPLTGPTCGNSDPPTSRSPYVKRHTDRGCNRFFRAAGPALSNAPSSTSSIAKGIVAGRGGR